jgi:hypothetical protein
VGGVHVSLSVVSGSSVSIGPVAAYAPTGTPIATANRTRDQRLFSVVRDGVLLLLPGKVRMIPVFRRVCVMPMPMLFMKALVEDA